MKKVNKTVARRLFKEGKRIYMLPCKVAFDNCWISPLSISLEAGHDFEKMVNEYTYYNCNSPLGKYIAYYVSE